MAGMYQTAQEVTVERNLGSCKYEKFIIVKTAKIDEKMFDQFRYCSLDSLNKTLVDGKIVFCDALSEGEGALQSGAVGTIMQDGGFKDVAFSFPLSASYLTLEDGAEVSTFINTTRYVSNLESFSYLKL